VPEISFLLGLPVYPAPEACSAAPVRTR